MQQEIYRQGDVLFIRVGAIPADATPRRSNVIVEGETTGHAHRLVGGDIVLANTVMFLACLNGAQVVHEEHNTISLPPGIWQVRRQREYSPEEIRTVID